MKQLMILAAALLLALPGTQAAAQEQGFVVRDIRIEGLQRISEGAVLNYLPVNIGDTLDAGSVRQLLRGLNESGFFADIEFRRDGDALVVAAPGAADDRDSADRGQQGCQDRGSHQDPVRQRYLKRQSGQAVGAGRGRTVFDGSLFRPRQIRRRSQCGRYRAARKQG